MAAVLASRRGGIGFENLSFAAITFVLVLLAHAIAFLTHEYAHSFCAWALGWMANPLALDYGHATVRNVVFLGEVEDNVQYDPIFAAGQGATAALIALAGPFLGNGALYFLLYRLARTSLVGNSRLGLSFVYWLSLMCAGNVWSYVPIRAITTHADIALAARGLGISVWLLFPFLIVPSLYLVFHFFGRMFAACHRKVSSGSGNNLALMIAVTAYWYFAFFGGDGVGGRYGLIPEIFSIMSEYFLFPLAVMWLAATYHSAARDDARANLEVRS